MTSYLMKKKQVVFPHHYKQIFWPSAVYLWNSVCQFVLEAKYHGAMFHSG